jgi:hypothetical protein
MFLHVIGFFYEKQPAKLTRFWASRARFKAFKAHIWPAGHMLCMPAIGSSVFQLSELKPSLSFEVQYSWPSRRSPGWSFLYSLKSSTET